MAVLVELRRRLVVCGKKDNLQGRCDRSNMYDSRTIERFTNYSEDIVSNLNRLVSKSALLATIIGN